MNSKTKGRLAELNVIHLLEKNNYKILKHNYFSKYGEIDIITKKNNSYQFIEVKAISSEFINPIYKLNKKKKERIFKTSLDFLRKINYKNENIEYYIIVVQNNKINYYRFEIDEEYSI